ncbi:hypothetical protein HanPI659440_Chr15g0586511 [Helianthus annuus]|nr:hypothetical protein HanPI659440_Chr15g0586511 [Helianthus annuus]
MKSMGSLILFHHLPEMKSCGFDYLLQQMKPNVHHHRHHHQRHHVHRHHLHHHDDQHVHSDHPHHHHRHHHRHDHLLLQWKQRFSRLLPKAKVLSRDQSLRYQNLTTRPKST